MSHLGQLPPWISIKEKQFSVLITPYNYSLRARMNHMTQDLLVLKLEGALEVS